MFTSTGIFHYDPLPGTKHYEPNWALLKCDEDIANYYAWHLKKHGVEVDPFNLWGVHVSSLKGDLPVNPEVWGKYEGYEVEFHYNHIIRYDNGKHAWVDVYSEDLSAIREELGFPPKFWYHLTIGRLVRPFNVDFTNYGIR